MKKIKNFLLNLTIFFLSPTIFCQTTTFNYTGGMQTFTVPANTYELSVDIYGAEGGFGGGGMKPGGLGGRVQTNLTVSPGQVLNIFVGGAGIGVTSSTPGPHSGGYNGGGDSYSWGGSGGGASDIRIGGTTLSDRVIVAGGGGGAGDDYPNVGDDAGGDGGGLIGENGAYETNHNTDTSGTGGTQISGGIGGVHASTLVDPALDGALGVGGRSSTTYAGGGGGGGYYGGGGGAAAGGGGGSSFASNTLTTGTIHTQGVQNGNGLVVITELCNPTPPVPDLQNLPVLESECSIALPVSPTASNCLGNYSGTPNVSFPITTQGTTIITWTYVDGNGNTSTQTQEVIIDDVTAPVADAASLADLTDECEITSLTAPTATDNCAGAVTGTHNATLPITATTTITWTYDDGNGNTTTQTQQVIVDDVTAPVADIASLADLTDECEITALTSPTATDNCVGTITGTHNVTLPITSTTAITWTYDDGNGNTSTQTQEVIITPIDNSVTVVNDITLAANANGYTYQWIDCNDNTPIAGETNQTFEATVNGSFAVIIDNGTCSDTSECFGVSTVGISENEFANINVYPNPTNGMVNINTSTPFNYIEVINIMGKVVYSADLDDTNKMQIIIPATKGIYLIKVSNDEYLKTYKIIRK